MSRIAIFVSGSGSNCENLIRYFSESETISVSLVLSSSSSAYALVRAESLAVPSVVVSKQDFQDPDYMLPLMKKFEVDFIVLAGFLRVIPDFLIEAYDRKMINIHPSLLPDFGGMGMYGMNVHKAVKAAGRAETGMTVHYVSNEVDGGEIIAQFSTAISPEDTPEDIAAKEHVLEMEHFPKVVERILTDTFQNN